MNKSVASMEGLTALKAYKQVYGNVNVPRGTKQDGFSLGGFVYSQRTHKKKGTLSEESIKQLNELGFVWDVLDARYQEGLAALKAYKQEHGDVNVPKGAKQDGFSLGGFVYSQRTSKQKGSLSEEHIKQLNELGFVWDVSDTRYQAGLLALKAYKQAHGNVNITRGTKQDGFNLRNWVGTQRAKYNKGTLSEERIKQLNELGFIWARNR
jgi:hypothetical protein|tara:strand:+ start:695 stop:1321 length:627 start_codon:yes stop_codon:yes gene_type:complete